MARPTKLTTQVQEAICTFLQLGADYANACRAAGIHYDTFNRWRTRGAKAREQLEAGEKIAKADHQFVRFYDAVEQANAEAMIVHLQHLDTHAQFDPTVSKWILERRFPDVFGPPKETHDVNHGGMLKVIRGEDFDLV